MSEQANIAARYEREIPEGYEAKIEDNKVIFELKQSEDERIRQALIRFFKNTHDWVNLKYDGDEIVAYLERQKEQKPAECVADSRKFDEGFKTGREVGFREGVESVKPEQKWDEEDEEMLEDIRFNFQFNKGKMTDALIAQYNRFFDKIMSLKPQSQQEWSEEDKRAIDRACVALRAYSNGDLPEFLPSELLGYADRLQALLYHPHWKPSEEQMKALNKVVNGEVLLTTQHESLESLYEQLKKL